MRLTQTHIKNLLLSHGVHPHIVKQLHAAGFFSSLISGLKKAASYVFKNKDSIINTAKKAYSVGKEAHDLYSRYKRGDEEEAPKEEGSGMRRRHRVLHASGIVTGAGMRAGKITGGKAHKKRTSSWIEDVKSYARDTGLPYKQAMIELSKERRGGRH